MEVVICAIIGFAFGAGLATFYLWQRAKVFTSLERERAEVMRLSGTTRADQAALEAEMKSFAARKVSVEEMAAQARVLKRDLQNLDIQVSKLELDRQEQAARQRAIEERANELAIRYLGEVEKWVTASINASNFTASKQRIERALQAVRDIGYEVPPDRERQLFEELRVDFERAVRIALDREEQARIKARIREEQAREREVQKELQNLERERHAIQAALDRALADAKAEHSAEVERLRARLLEAEAKSQRAIAQAQLTKSGHIYVISNIGSFGEDVYKIGMTRRLEPLERVAELGDASVPFPFDVHMMISCDDAPAMENELHRTFSKRRVNRVNPRKEFFRVSLEEIKRVVEAKRGEVAYTASPEALEYRQSQSMSEADQAYIDSVFDSTEKTLGISGSEE